MGYRYVIFDFDGVLAETNQIRFQGFEELFRDLPDDVMTRFMDFVRANGGLSRYGKIRHLYKNLLGRPASENEVAAMARRYSEIVMQKVIDAQPVSGSMDFLAEHEGRFQFAVVSGSDQEELRQVCRARGISHFFQAILGSPREKKDNLVNLLAREGWDRRASVYVGDSQNDYLAATGAGIDFIARESGVTDWSDAGVVRVSNLHELPHAMEELSSRRRHA
jgi:phosphoglycolate phosphatase-like HAD superfamily hydrolase